MKIIKRALLEFFGKELIGILNRWVVYKRHSRTGRFARFGIDKKLESLLPHRNGFYVELGANDGALASNSYYFELKKDWTGVLIEPCPNLYLSCLKRRNEKNYVFCNACVPFDFVDKHVTMIYSDSMTISDSLNLSIDCKNDFIQSGHKYLQPGESSFEFGAIAVPLNTLLITANAPSLIDFLSLDVEGAELEVLKGIDFKKFNFRYIIIESRDIDILKNFLSAFGYVLREKISHNDYLFALESNLA